MSASVTGGVSRWVTESYLISVPQQVSSGLRLLITAEEEERSKWGGINQMWWGLGGRGVLSGTRGKILCSSTEFNIFFVGSMSNPLTWRRCCLFCTVASHQGEIETLWLHFWWAVMSSIFVSVLHLSYKDEQTQTIETNNSQSMELFLSIFKDNIHSTCDTK